MQLNSQDVDSLCRLVHELCGVYLDESKSYLVESRLATVAHRASCDSLGELVRQAISPDGLALRHEIIDAMTTHETLFFRDESPFQALTFKALPELLDMQLSSHSGRRLRIWSAACSTGQEVYSLAITLMETMGDVSGWDIEILGTDVSPSSVEQARRGVYTALEADRGLSRERRERWFESTPEGWRVCESLRQMTRFEPRNLLAPLPERDYFHLVFCRNVAIYFAPSDRRSLFERLTQTMVPQGYLFVGSSENLADLGPAFRPELHCRSVFYRPRFVNPVAVR